MNGDIRSWRRLGTGNVRESAGLARSIRVGFGRDMTGSVVAFLGGVAQRVHLINVVTGQVVDTGTGLAIGVRIAGLLADSIEASGIGSIRTLFRNGAGAASSWWTGKGRCYSVLAEDESRPRFSD